MQLPDEWNSKRQVSHKMKMENSNQTKEKKEEEISNRNYKMIKSQEKSRN